MGHRGTGAAGSENQGSGPGQERGELLHKLQPGAQGKAGLSQPIVVMRSMPIHNRRFPENALRAPDLSALV